MDKQPRQHKSTRSLDVTGSEAKTSSSTLEEKHLHILG